jgi:hypothetical protein
MLGDLSTIIRDLLHTLFHFATLMYAECYNSFLLHFASFYIVTEDTFASVRLPFSKLKRINN